MRSLKTWITLLLTAVWLPATSHCLLEANGLLPSDQCCKTVQAVEGRNSHACADQCQNLEDGFFKVQDNTAMVFAPVEVLVWVQELPEAPPKIDRLNILESPPPALHLPQFLVRTALPVRGPSLVS